MTPAEASFVLALRSSVADLDVWLHETNGLPWLIASVDVVKENWIVSTWRVEFDGATICGGLSPASLNWDDGLSADEAGIDTGPPTGLAATKGSPEDLAASAATWLNVVTRRA